MKPIRTGFTRAVELFLATLVIGLWFLPQDLSAQTPFYQGKTITLIQGREPGGSGDMSVRVLIPYLQKYIPGNPTVVTEFIPGAGGRKAANQLYRSARPDGLTIGNIGGGLILNAVLGEPGVQYDLDKFIYLGTSESAIVWVFLTRKEAGLGSLEKLRSAGSVRIGAQSVGHIIYMCGRLFAYILGMKDAKFVTGYSGPELDIALSRGEVDARANIADTLLKRTPEFLERGLVPEKDEKTFGIDIIDPAAKEPIARLDFENCGFKEFAFSAMEANKDPISAFTVTMYCEKVKLTINKFSAAD